MDDHERIRVPLKFDFPGIECDCGKTFILIHVRKKPFEVAEGTILGET